MARNFTRKLPKDKCANQDHQMWSHGPPIGELFHLDDNSTWGLRCENCFNHYNGTGFWSGTVFKPFGKSDQRACAGKCTCELASLMRIGCKCGGK